jgi:SAM-dependent methyltransferase
VLEVGCGPGHLARRLARHGLKVTGVDLDPAMVARARAGAGRRGDAGHPRLAFLVGDAAALAFPDGAFDLVVSTLSVHHWADPAAGLAEVGRVLRPGGRALVWGTCGPAPGPTPSARATPACPTRSSTWAARRSGWCGAAPWRWPWRLTPTQRVELVRDGGPPGPPSHSEASAQTCSRPASGRGCGWLA